MKDNGRRVVTVCHSNWRQQQLTKAVLVTACTGTQCIVKDDFSSEGKTLIFIWLFVGSKINYVGQAYSCTYT